MDSEKITDDARFRSSFENVQKKLKDLLQRKPGLATGLQISLKNASQQAKKILQKDLYEGIDEEFNFKGWPETIEEWGGIIESPRDGNLFREDVDGNPDCFLWLSATWLPNEEGTAWRGKNGYNEKLLHMICHFYFLIAVNWSENSELHISNKVYIQPQLDDDFNHWLVEFVKVNEAFLDSEYSLKKFKGNFSWHQICNDPTIRDSDQYRGYTLDRFKDNMTNWKTFNQFFYRRFNGANHKNGGISPTENLIYHPKDNHIITAPAFCTYQQKYHIEKNGDIVAIDKFPSSNSSHSLYNIGVKNGKLPGETHIKGVPVSNIADLIQSSNHVDDFCGGTFVHYYLSASEYHRCHLPVTGKVIEAKQIPGYAYTQVVVHNDKGEADGNLHAHDDATDGFEFVQSRGLVIIDTKYYPDENGTQQEELNGPTDVGKIAVLPIGMSQVSGVGINETLEGEVVSKGWEFGRFKFGGSDIILLFDRRATLEFENNDGENKHYEFGEPIARITNVKQKLPSNEKNGYISR